MKQMQRDPNASDKARRAERRADEKSGLISIKPIKIEAKSSAAGGASGSGFKKGGFKSAFGGGGSSSSAGETTKKPVVLGVVEAFQDEQSGELERERKKDVKEDVEETEEFGYEYYDPMRPTGCGEAGCLKAC